MLAALDPNTGDALSFSILAGADGSQFQIVGNELRVGSAGLNFEAGNTRTVSVRASDLQDYLSIAPSPLR